MDLTATLFGCNCRFSRAHDLYVTVMRHLFSQFFSIVLLTHLVIAPAIFRFLIALAGRALFFCAGQWCTGWAESVASVAMTADAHELMTTLALKNPAIWEGHL
jgi:hypothetical protein